MTDQIPNEYTTPGGQTVEIVESKGKFLVRCWKDNSLHWEVGGVVTKDNGVLQERRDFTRDEALAEFNRWRT